MKCVVSIYEHCLFHVPFRSTFKWATSYLGGGGGRVSERLPGWFVNFLLIFALSKTDKKGKKVLLGACLTEGGGGL